MRIKKIIVIMFLASGLALFFPQPHSRATGDFATSAWASGGGDEHGGGHGEAKKDDGHGDDAGGGEHHGAPPVSYYLFWLMLFGVAGLWGYQYTEAKKLQGDEHHEAHGTQPLYIPVLLIVLVFLAFFTESLGAMGHYHEPMSIGLVRIAGKVACCLMLLTYGLSFIHEEHDDGDDGHGEDAHGH